MGINSQIYTLEGHVEGKARFVRYLGDDGTRAPLKLQHGLVEGRQVSIKLYCLHVQGVVLHLAEGVKGSVELRKDAACSGSEGFALQ